MRRVSLRASSSNQGYAGTIIPRYSLQKQRTSHVDTCERRRTVRTRRARLVGGSVMASTFAITFTISESSAIFSRPVEMEYNHILDACHFLLCELLWKRYHSSRVAIILQEDNWETVANVLLSVPAELAAATCCRVLCRCVHCSHTS